MKYPRIFVFLALVASLTVVASGCEKKQEAPANEGPAKSAPETDEPRAKAPGNAKQEPAAEYVGTVMKPYEECRALLADDNADGVADCATAMAAAAKAAQAEAPEAAKAPLAEIAGAAETLAAAKPDDLDNVRKLYGDVSKPVVALLTAVPSAAKDYHVFECPMAKGYQRWAQHDAKLANPYMGTKMRECGTEVHDHHKGMGMGGDGHMMDGDHHGGQ